MTLRLLPPCDPVASEPADMLSLRLPSSPAQVETRPWLEPIRISPAPVANDPGEVVQPIMTATSPSIVHVTMHHYRIHESGRHAIRDDGRVTPLAEWGIDMATPGAEFWRSE